MADRPGRVLVVDDNKVNRLLLARTLELQGHHVESAENGRLALTRLSADDFDLVLLDIEMPEVNGFECSPGSSRIVRSATSPSSSHRRSRASTTWSGASSWGRAWVVPRDASSASLPNLSQGRRIR